MLPVVGAALRPRAMAAIAGRLFATQTMRGLRSLTETQLPSVRVSPTQDDLPAVVCAPATMGSRVTTVANGARLLAGVVSAMDASSARVTAAANLRPSAVAITAAPTPATTRHASATRSLRRKGGVGQKSRIRDECNGTQARGGVSNKAKPRSQAPPWKYNARLYGRGLSKIAHSEGAPARTGNAIPSAR